MSESKIRQATDACSAAGPSLLVPNELVAYEFVANEPSHIHIPRPSRLRQSASLERTQREATALQLGLADEAA
jgi:hypothetical protein